jgi:serine/threonine-protein kinase/endoribonuclease IRE1
VLAVLLFLPFISSAAQQQQQPENARRRSLREDARVVGAITLPKHGKHTQASVEDAVKRSYAPLAVLNERAVATTVPPAPANPAVRALPARNAASSGGLSRPSARSLQDWEVEDFVLLATVDGHIHARDRYDGKEIWELNINKPMLETIYNTQNDSEGDHDIKNMPFLWIVEPKEDGTLYVLTPGPYPVLQSLGMTVKQLAEVSPYSSDDPPVVYVAEKRNSMHVVDARTGNITKSFSAGGSMVTDGESCSPKPTNYFDSESEEDKCKGFFNLGQTEYIVSIQNKNTGANICTIKYAEWTPNNRDRDLQVQYLEPHENQYIYSRYDGHAIAYDHKRPKRSSKYLSFQMKLSSPVVRVFDIARALDDDDLESALVLLPQPPGPAIIEEKAKHVWLNTTDSGSWYALSEASFPAVTDSAPPASCYTQSDVLSWDGPYYLPDRSGLVGVHVLDYQVEPPSHREVPGIAAPVHDDPRVIVPVPELPPPKETLVAPPETLIESRSQTNWWPLIVTLAVLLTGSLSYQMGQPTKFDVFKKNLLSRFSKPEKVDKLEQPMVATPFVSEPATQEAQVTLTATETPAPGPLTEDSPAKEHMDVEPRQRKVMFDIPDEEDADLEPLSRTTTAEQPSPISDGEANGFQAPKPDVAHTLNGIEGNVDDPAATPTKKKKAHRGKRGGKKLAKGPKDKDEVDRIVDAVKHLDQTPTLHPDERTMNDQDIQDVSNVKRIGKLTIDCDRLLGNGSGGTFVFEGKWNVSCCRISYASLVNAQNGRTCPAKDCGSWQKLLNKATLNLPTLG